MAASLSTLDPGQNATINPNFPSAAPWDSNGAKHVGIVADWNGAAFDQATDRYWLGLAGGHQSYGGNEVYKAEMSAAGPFWSMVRRPSGAIGNVITINDGQEATGIYPDGRPRSGHTYNRLIHVPGVGPVMCGVGTVYINAGGKCFWAFIDETTGEHSFTTDPGLSVDNMDGAAACYDPSRRAIWWFESRTSQGAYRYDIPSSGPAHLGTFTAVGSAFDKKGYVTATYLPDDDCILVGCDNFEPTASSQVWYVFDCATGLVTTPTFTGSLSGSMRLGKQAWPWVPALGKLCSWDNASSTTLISTLQPTGNPRTAGWTVSSLPVSGANAVTPGAAAGNGTFGRFAYSSRMGGFLVFSSTSGAINFYKI